MTLDSEVATPVARSLTRQVGDTFALFVTVVMTAVIVEQATGFLPGITPSGSPVTATEMVAPAVIALSGCAGFVFTYVKDKYTPRKAFAALGFRASAKYPLWMWSLVALGIAGVMLAADALGLWQAIGLSSLPDDVDPRMIAVNTAPWPIIIIHTVLRAPLLEEIIFRSPVIAATTFGPQLPRWPRWVLYGGSIILTAVFGLMHYLGGSANVVAAMVFGVAITIVSVVSKSIYPGMVAHGAYNVTAYLLSAA